MPQQGIPSSLHKASKCDKNTTPLELLTAASLLEAGSFGLDTESIIAGMETAGVRGVFEAYQICLRGLADAGIDDRTPVERIYWRTSRLFANAVLNAEASKACADNPSLESVCGSGGEELRAALEERGIIGEHEHDILRLAFERHLNRS